MKDSILQGNPYSFFGCNNDYTIRTSCSIDSCSRCIFQYVDLSNTGRINGARLFHTDERCNMDDEQRSSLTPAHSPFTKGGEGEGPSRDRFAAS